MCRCSPLARSIAGLAICASLLFPSSQVPAAYLLQSGDVLELVVAGVPDLRQRATVGIDGDVSFPLVGQLAAGGKDIADLRARLLAGMASMTYQQRTTDGREVTHIIRPEEISVSVVEHRRIYLSGDVARPGEQPYRSGMTVRQAIAVAGGYQVARIPTDQFIESSSNLRAEYEVLWSDYAHERAREWRVRTELGETVEANPMSVEASIVPELMNQLFATELNQLKARTADLERERNHLQDAVDHSTTQLAVLAERLKEDEEAYRADVADFEKIREQFRRGVTANARISEERRTVLLSSTRILRTIVEISNIERQRTEYLRQKNHLIDQRRSDLLNELQETTIRIAQLRARLRGVEAKVLYSSSVQSELIRGSGARPQLVIHRPGTPRSIPGDEDTELQPGDTVSIALLGNGSEGETAR
jgi:polysaccharide export outer membrane protein